MTDKPMSAERLEEVRTKCANYHPRHGRIPVMDMAQELLAEIDRLRAPPDDAEVAHWVKNLTAAGGNQGSFTASERLRYRTLADLLTRLSERAEKAERERDQARSSNFQLHKAIVRFTGNA